MNWKRGTWVLMWALCVVLAVSIPGAWAQDYVFTVDRNISHVIVQRDGSADIEYWLTYTCAENGHPIDIVDVGLPNDSYDLDTAQAWYSPGTGGEQEVPLTDVRRSEWLSVGVEVHLDEYTIQPGDQGTLHLRINVKEMVYPDTEDETYASVEFAPHFYDKENVRGKTYMEIHFYFPPGVTNEETRYHGQEFDETRSVDDRFVFIYRYPEATGSETHQHGISFPRTYVEQVYKVPLVTGTSGSKSGFSFDDFTGCFCVGGFLVIFVAMTASAQVRNKKRKMEYLPPELSVEGVGIKRGLTAVEAAILLEQPLNKVLTMIMFGLLKKRAIVVTSEDPLRLQAVEPRPRRKWRAYENRFMESIQPDGTLDEDHLQEGIVDLVKALNKKLKGFSRKETIAYYRSIVDRAWDQVTAETTPEIKSQYFDQGLEWMMMDEKFEERTEQTFQGGPVFMPSWWAHYRPWVPRVRASRTGSGNRTSSPRGGGGGRQITLPTLPGAAFASTLVSGVESTAGGIVSRLDRFTGGVTQTTNPPPVSSSRSSSGSSCACACACAGCACACAGGGR